MRWILVVLPTVYYLVLKPIKQFFYAFFLYSQPTVHQKFIHFPRHSSAVGESNFHMVEYRIIDNISQWLNFQASSTLWSRQLHFVIVLQSLAVQVAFQFIGMKYLLCRAEQSARKWCREGVVKLEKSLNFLSSLEWQLSLFLLMLGVRVASEASESAAVEAVFYGRSSRFPTDVNSRLSNHGELRSTRCVLSSAAAVKSTSLARRKRES